MAIQNPQGNFNFRLQLGALDMAAVQMVTPPSIEYAEHKQGSEGNSPDIKTPGKKIVGDLVVEIVVPANGGEATWLQLQSNDSQERNIYAGDGFLYETDGLGVPITPYSITGAWLKKVETGNYETKSDNSDNLKRTLTFSISDYQA